MKKNTHDTRWVLALLFLGLTAGLAGTVPTLAGDANKNKPDAQAEAAQEAAEDAKQNEESIGGRKQQRMFHGTFLLISDPSQQTNPAVVGTFVTDDKDMKPAQTYLVKLDKGHKEVLEMLQRVDLKKVTVEGKVRNDGKYLIVTRVVESAPSPPVAKHRTPGGL